MDLVDIHSHALYGVDDGPENQIKMQEVVDAAYADGVRMICLTPHFNPSFFGYPIEQAQTSFALLKAYVGEKYPDLKLILGNELRYSIDAPVWLVEGKCRTLGDTDYVLVDFFENEPEKTIVKGLRRLVAAGYKPILAHAERYRKLPVKTVAAIARSGIWIQIDVQSIFGDYGGKAKRRCRRLLRKKLVDIAASDAHDVHHRPPTLSRGYRYVERKYGSKYAQAIFRKNPLGLLMSRSQEGTDTDYE